MSTFATQFYNAIELASIYLLIALGISLVYGLARVVNFAQGELVTLGAFIALELHDSMSTAVAILLSALAVGALSQPLYFGLFRSTMKRPFNGFIISIGLIVGLEGLWSLVWPQASYSIPPIVSGSWTIGGVVIDRNGALLIGVAAVAAAVLIRMLSVSSFGRTMRAIAEDPLAVAVLGVRTTRRTALTFAIGSLLAGLAGGLLGTLFPFNAYFGSSFLLDGFAVAIVGGLGSIPGAVVAAVVLALAQTLGGAYVSLGWSSAFGLAAIIVIILVRPTGIFRGTESGEILGADDSAVNIEWETYENSKRAAASAAGSLRDVRVAPWLGIPLTALLLGVAPFVLQARYLSDATYAVILAIAAYGVWFLFRFAGILSISQAAFMGIAGYTAAVTSTRWHLGVWPQLGLAIAAAALASLVVGLLCLRTRGSYFLIMLFAVNELIVQVMTNWQSVTGGSQGVIVVSAPSFLGQLVNFSDPTEFFYLAAVFLVVTVTVLRWVSVTAFGRRLTMIRDSEVLSESLGVKSYGHRVAAFVLAGAIGGLAGMLLLYQQNAIEPTQFSTFPGVYLVLMVLLGGGGTLVGPLLGAIIITFIPEVLNLGPNTTQLVNGILLIAIISLLPIGVGGSIRRWVTGALLRRHHDVPEASSPGPASISVS